MSRYGRHYIFGDNFSYEAMNVTWEGYEKGSEPHDYETIEGVGERPNWKGIMKDVVGIPWRYELIKLSCIVLEEFGKNSLSIMN